MTTPYDDIPYPGQPFSQTHPDRMATLAILHGLTPPAVDRARVLELGCGDGANLIPMALTSPQGKFVGIDLSGRAIAAGQSIVTRLEPGNISLLELDMMDIGSDFGEFDYIIAHGLYAWVPEPVREKLLDICRVNLAPNGIAFISYNTYPGGHLRDMLREMVLYHTRNETDPRKRIHQAFALIRFLADSYSESDLYGQFLKVEIDAFLRRAPEYFFHDEMSGVCARPYFHEFVERANAHQLQYLSEAVLLTVQTGAFAPEVAKTVNELSAGDPIATEQYIDFLKLRSFRQSLLCHSELKIDRVPRAERVSGMHVAAPSQPVSAEPDLRSHGEESFRYPSGGSMATNHPLGKSALVCLGRAWPESIAFAELLHAARALAGRESESIEEDREWLSGLVLKAYAAHFLELYTHPPQFRTELTERPEASALARLQAAGGGTITNLRHAAIKVEDARGLNLLQLLDGTRDRTALLRDLRTMPGCTEVQAGEVESNLAKLGRLALLVR